LRASGSLEARDLEFLPATEALTKRSLSIPKDESSFSLDRPKTMDFGSQIKNHFSNLSAKVESVNPLAQKISDSLA
jgi:hypothetical protein